MIAKGGAPWKPWAQRLQLEREVIVLVEHRRGLRRERRPPERPGPREPGEEDDPRLAVVQRPEQRILREAGELVAGVAPHPPRGRGGGKRRRGGRVGGGGEGGGPRPAGEGEGPAPPRGGRGGPPPHGA